MRGAFPLHSPRSKKLGSNILQSPNYAYKSCLLNYLLVCLFLFLFFIFFYFTYKKHTSYATMGTPHNPAKPLTPGELQYMTPSHNPGHLFMAQVCLLTGDLTITKFVKLIVCNMRRILRPYRTHFAAVCESTNGFKMVSNPSIYNAFCRRLQIH